MHNSSPQAMRMWLGLGPEFGIQLGLGLRLGSGLGRGWIGFQLGVGLGQGLGLGLYPCAPLHRHAKLLAKLNKQHSFRLPT